MASMERLEIETRLLYTVRGLRTEELFTGASAIDVALDITRAVQRMVDEGRTGDNDVAEAEQTLLRLLVEMDRVRQELRLAEFHEITWGRAKELCPGLWPFC
jgi:hypothetical protein